MARRDDILAKINLTKAKIALSKGDTVGFVDSIMTLLLKGRDGYTPVLGKDYYTPQQQKMIVEAIMKQIRQPKDGKPGLRGLKGDTVIGPRGPQGLPGRTPAAGVDFYTDAEKWAFIDRVKEEIMPTLMKEMKEQLAAAVEAMPKVIERRSLPQISLIGRAGGARVRYLLAGSPLGEDIQTVDFGSGLTAARGGEGYLIVTATGGGGGGVNLATEVVTAVTSGNNVTINLTQLSHSFAAVQLVFRSGGNVPPGSAPADGSSAYTISGNTLTIYNAGSGDGYLVTYTY